MTDTRFDQKGLAEIRDLLVEAIHVMDLKLLETNKSMKPFSEVGKDLVEKVDDIERSSETRTTKWKKTENPTVECAFESEADIRDVEDAKKNRNDMWALFNESYNSYTIFRKKSQLAYFK